GMDIRPRKGEVVVVRTLNRSMGLEIPSFGRVIIEWGRLGLLVRWSWLGSLRSERWYGKGKRLGRRGWARNCPLGAKGGVVTGGGVRMLPYPYSILDQDESWTHTTHPHCEALKTVSKAEQSSMAQDGSVFVYNPDVLREQFMGLKDYLIYFHDLLADAGESVRAGDGIRGVWGILLGWGEILINWVLSSQHLLLVKWEMGHKLGVRLMDRFHRLFHLDRYKESVVADKGRWDEVTWRWFWDWVREPRGRVVGELEELEQTMSNTNITLNDRDTWKWVLDDSGTFSIKALLVEVKCINTKNHNCKTMWNNLVPKKVNIFAWRAARGRLQVWVELDKKGINLHTILCPNCDEMYETVDHSLIFCKEAMKVWEKVFEWWNLHNVNVFSTKEMLRWSMSFVDAQEDSVELLAPYDSNEFIWRKVAIFNVNMCGHILDITKKIHNTRNCVILET
nr:RNA-directed DNA polymerase, eukaryota, reverse transcriptase zinc-binding domain protein [Tanacetum cinerariifolium]